MKAIHFPQSNKVLRAPRSPRQEYLATLHSAEAAGLDVTEHRVRADELFPPEQEAYDLHVWGGEVQGIERCISCWEPSPEERVAIAAGGPVWLWVMGTTHPPLVLDAASPFEPAAPAPEVPTRGGPPADRILARLPAQRDDLNDIAEEYVIVAMDTPPGVMIWGRVENRWFANPSAREVVRQLLGRALLAAPPGSFEDWWGANAADIMAELRPQGIDVGDAEDIAQVVFRRLSPLAGLSRATEAGAEWPPGVSDGLSLPCHDCGQIPRFDYVVADEFWSRWVGGAERLGVVCLPCLDRRCHGEGLAEALQQVQWTGTGHTDVLVPVLSHRYEAKARAAERPTVAESFQELLARVTLTPEEEQAVSTARIGASHEVDTLLAIIDRMTVAPSAAPAASIYRADGEADER